MIFLWSGCAPMCFGASLSDQSDRQMKELWSGRQESNLRPPRPKRGALPLRYAPAITLHRIMLPRRGPFGDRPRPDGGLSNLFPIKYSGNIYEVC